MPPNCRYIEDHGLDLIDLGHGVHHICKGFITMQTARSCRDLSMTGGVLGDTLAHKQWTDPARLETLKKEAPLLMMLKYFVGRVWFRLGADPFRHHF